MKIAISSNDGKMNTPFSPRFGRCDYFLLINTDTRDWEAVSNPAVTASGGAGSQVVQFLAKHGVEATISGHYGPTAFSALQAAGISGYEATQGAPEELLESFQSGELRKVETATGPGRHRK